MDEAVKQTADYLFDSEPETVKPAEADAGALLNALPDPLLQVARDAGVQFANLAAEQFFAASAATLCNGSLHDLLPADSPLFALIEQVFAGGHGVSEYGVILETPRIGSHLVDLHVAPIVEAPDSALVTLRARARAQAIDQLLLHRGAARSVTAMAALLAHEVKNPLSGIRGAAQLLDRSVASEDRGLTRLIREEADRICALVDRMEVFDGLHLARREPVNIHQVLTHVRQIAENGFARRTKIDERYDPSLPPVYGNRDQLIQVFLNLVKNAAEAAPRSNGEIVISTAYHHGVRMALPGGDTRVQLPIAVTIQDNGEGVPEDVRAHLFDPFVTTKTGGSGLGLALVAKIIGDHGGVIEFDSAPRRTAFRVMLPIDGADDWENI